MFFGISQWPSRHKQTLLTVFVFLALVIVSLVATVLNARTVKNNSSNFGYSMMTSKLSSLAGALVKEAQTAVMYTANISDTSAYDAMIIAQTETDAAYVDSYQTVQNIEFTYTWSYVGPTEYNGTLFTRQGFSSLLFIRSRLLVGESVINTHDIRKRYLQILEVVVALMASCARDHGQKEGFTSLLNAYVISSSAYTFLQIEEHYIKFKKLISDPSLLTDALVELRQVLINLLRFQTIVESLLRPSSSESNNLILDVYELSYNINEQVNMYIAAATKNELLSKDLAELEIDSFAPIISFMKNMQAGIHDEKVTTKQTLFTSLIYTILIISIIFFVMSLVELFYFRVYDAKRSALRLHHDKVMHDTLLRVEEYVNEIATFTLSPDRALKSMSDKKVGIVELQLKYLMGSLTTLTPSLPPLLLPDRFQSLAVEYSEVKDPATMSLSAPPRETVKNDSVDLITQSEVNPFLVNMERETDLQETICDVAMMYVSLIALHNITSTEEQKFAEEYYQKIVSTIEECVYEFNGVLHSVAFDKAVAIWNVAERSCNFSESAAQCALALAQRLFSLRQERRSLREHFPINIGIVGGTVDVGIFGDEEKKFISVFGPPILRGMFVAQTNLFHGTMVSCDNYIRNAVSNVYFCKPTELIPDGGCVFTLIEKDRRTELEDELKLSSYTQAFELFEKRFYKRALKAFRTYTKEYGYDTSVERIQALITGSKDISF